MQEEEKSVEHEHETEPEPDKFYRVQFREDGQIHLASSRMLDLVEGDVVMVKADKHLEPMRVLGQGPQLALADCGSEVKAAYTLLRRGNREECARYVRLVEQEDEAVVFCQRQIDNLGLAMKLVRVERFFNGSKIIFYFTSENRVDFRQLVKNLVQEFRTRVEMRQIGVRHESKMIGGLGCCGRELCCSTYLNSFVPVSIKMAKEQDLPLNPAKISGICNRLLCCLTYEYKNYRQSKKILPRFGQTIYIDKKPFTVIKRNVLQEKVTVKDAGNPEITKELSREEWTEALKQDPAPAGRGSSRGSGATAGRKRHPRKKKGKERRSNKPGSGSEKTEK